MATADKESTVTLLMKCEDESCEVKDFNFRHPQNFKFILQNKNCCFGSICDFEHRGVTTIFKEETLKQKVLELDKILMNNVIEMEELKREIKDIFQNEEKLLSEDFKVLSV